MYISGRELPGNEDAVARAACRFEKLGMTRTRNRNGVLRYFAPRSNRFAIIGDTGIHRACGQEFWDGVAGGMRRHLAQGAFTQAILHGVSEAGRILATHFPALPDDRNELPDEVERD